MELIKEYSVSEFNKDLKKIVEKNFGYIKIRGEISNFKNHISGHFYFSLKDKDSVINAVMFRQFAEHVRFDLVDGLEVVVAGKITIYEGRSNYQIIVETAELFGIGSILKLLEERKNRLAALGYFDTTRKRIIKRLPKSVGIITSMTGAAIQDILARLKNRTPIKIYLYDSLVQGKEAANDIIQGIKYFNRMVERPDIIVITRGGGSIEDLLPFSDEKLVIEAFDSKIPIISAVGHEVDFSLLDYVADLRLPTPTSVAEHITISKDEAFYRLNEIFKRINQVVFEIFTSKQTKLNNLFSKIFKIKIKKYIKKSNRYNYINFKIKNSIIVLLKKYKLNILRLNSININSIVKNRILKRKNRFFSLLISLSKYTAKYPILETTDGRKITERRDLIGGEKYILKLPDGAVAIEIIKFFPWYFYK